MQSSTQLKGGHVFLHSRVAFSSGLGVNLMPKGEVVLISLCCYWRPVVGSSVEGATKLDPLGPGLQVCYLHCAHSFSAASCSGVGSGVAATGSAVPCCQQGFAEGCEVPGNIPALTPCPSAALYALHRGV